MSTSQPPQQPVHGQYQQPASRTQEETDRSHLSLLTIFYYIYAGLNLLGVCGGGIYLVLGIVGMANPNMFDEEIIAIMLMVMGAFITLLSLAFALLMFFNAKAIAQRKSRTFSLIMAALACLSVPLGTLLGVFTFIVLNRPSVKALYDQNMA